jgi:hypothetical protein
LCSLNFFLVVIALSVLWDTASDYTFGIFKLFCINIRVLHCRYVHVMLIMTTRRVETILKNNLSGTMTHDCKDWSQHVLFCFEFHNQIRINAVKGILKLILVIFCISWKLAIGSINDIYETLTRFLSMKLCKTDIIRW